MVMGYYSPYMYIYIYTNDVHHKYGATSNLSTSNMASSFPMIWGATPIHFTGVTGDLKMKLLLFNSKPCCWHVNRPESRSCADVKKESLCYKFLHQ